MMKSVALLLALSFVTIACAQPAPSPAPAPPAKPDLAAEERAIRELDARWLKAAQARDGAAEAVLFANDGTAVRPQGVFTGPAAFQEYAVKSYSENPKSQTTWSTDAIHVSESADLAIQYGHAETTGLGPKGDRKEQTRFVTVWKKVGGEWKVAYDIGTSLTPATTPKP